MHRVSGVAVFIAIGILLWLLGLSLSSADGFAQAAALLNSALARLVLWGILTALAYHLCGGIRHLLMDFGYLEESFSVGCRSAQLAFAATVLLSVCAGVWVW
ncbi:succinate dehydrogenase, cytochrome b556 subunit [Edwardsiella piscicida]|nr:succinate dehydrogenase, cytochrome b556 subunit [Edwardsiella piscicida]